MRSTRAAPPPPPSEDGSSKTVELRSMERSATASNSNSLEIDLRNKCWVKDSQTEWALATINSRSDGKLQITDRKNNKVEIAEDASMPVNTTVTDDMTSLHHLHEPGILFNLKKRYERRQIYTYMASALIAVNPFTRIPEPNADDYATKSRTELIPHPNAISETCFKNLAVLKKNQSVIISGESGAGKTETAKIVIKYLASRGIDRTGQSVDQTASDLYGKLQQLSPILESFGNAKTGRNSNSSRFGKFMKLLFAHSAVGRASTKTKLHLTGAVIETYMLEKSRVVYQSHGEGNFHIFYSLLQAAPSALHLDRSIHFRIAKKLPGTNAMPAIEESHQLANVTAAFRTLGLTAAMIDEVYKILAGILYLGNISFETAETAEGAIAKITALPSDEENPKYSGLSFLKLAAEALGVDITALRAILTTREMETRGEKYTVPLTVREAEFIRDATAKAIYEALFQRIVNMANASLLTGGNILTIGADILDSVESSSFIGVLDIFGFESFQINGFEQLLINYANEALQNTFNKQIFEKELQLFEEERIEVAIGDCPSNQACVELLSAKAESIFAILDSVSRQPQPSDERFCEELHKCFTTKKKSTYFGAVHRKDMRNAFVIQHYAATVKYHVGKVALAEKEKGTSSSSSASKAAGEENTIESAWIVKNNDSIPDGLEALFPSSSLMMVRSLAANGNVPMDAIVVSGGPSANGAGGGGGGGQPKRRKSVMMKPTIAATFVKSMSELNAMLDATTCHFIRCIKPNVRLVPDLFEDAFVVEQMRALGIVQACEVLKVSLPTRVTYQELKDALRTTIAKVKHLFGDDQESDVLLMSSLFKAYRIPYDAYRLGMTIAFFRAGQLATLERLLSTIPSATEEQRVATEIEEMVRRYHTVRNEVIKAENMVGTASEYVSELDRKQSRIRQAMLLLPEHRGLDIPDTVALGVTTIETRMKTLRIKQSEHLKHVSLLETLILQLSSAPASTTMPYRNQINRLREYGDTLETTLTQNATNYQKINDLLDEMEEAHAKGDASKLHTMMHDVAQDYELIMEGINAIEQTLAEVKLQAERGDFDAYTAHYAKIEEQLDQVGHRSRTMTMNLQVAGELLHDVEISAKLLDYAKVDTLIQQILQSLEKAATTIVQPEETLFQQAQADINRSIASFNSTLEQKQQQSIAATAATVAGGAPPAVPRKSGLYSLKDLAEAKRNGSISLASAPALLGPDGRPIKPERLKAATVPAAAANGTSTSTTPLASTLTSTTSAATTAVLPDGWKEYFDAKSQRPYYVNRVTKERQWKRPSLPAGGAASDAAAVAALASTTTTTSSSGGLTATSAAPSASNDEKRRSKRLPLTATTASGEQPLPSGWREVLDKKSGRYYYVNENTKARQWRRPEADGTMAPTAATAATSSTSNRVSRRIARPSTGTAASRSSTNPRDTMGEDLLDALEEDVDDVDVIVDTRRSSRRIEKTDRVSKRFDRESMAQALAASPTTSPTPASPTTTETAAATTTTAVSSQPATPIQTPIKPAAGYGGGIGGVPRALSPTSPSTAMLTAIASVAQSSSSYLTLKQEKIALARRASALLSTEDALVELELSEQDKRSVSYFQRIGLQRYTGYLMKQSKLLGRWRKRFFVLDRQLLVYFDSEKEFTAARQAAIAASSFREREPDIDWTTYVKAENKALYLSGAAVASFTTTDLCFSIATRHENDPAKDDEWFLLAKSEAEMSEWMRAVNAHIHVTFCSERGLSREDYWDKGNVSLTFWRVPVAMSDATNGAGTAAGGSGSAAANGGGSGASGGGKKAGQQRRPVGIRTLPYVYGPRTGEGLFPGDVVEIVQILEEHDLSRDTDDDATGRDDEGPRQRYLRLAGDRGWVFENHPTGNYAILERGGGTVTEALRRYQYDVNSLDALPIYLSPNCHHDEEDTGYYLSPGEIVEGIAEWHVSSSVFVDLYDEAKRADAAKTSAVAAASKKNKTKRPWASAAASDDDGDVEDADAVGADGDEDDEVLTLGFVKLRDGRGWAQLNHPVTGSVLLTPLDP